LPDILTIDDNEEIRTLWTEVLEEEGHEVIQAESGIVGVKIARARALDVIVTDIIMPDRDGLETIMEIQSHDLTAKIIAVLGGGSMLKESFLPVAGALGAVITLQKPVDINEFCAAVSTVAAA
jgi:CheY-like chemotaxis protein